METQAQATDSRTGVTRTDYNKDPAKRAARLGRNAHASQPKPARAVNLTAGVSAMAPRYGRLLAEYGEATAGVAVIGPVLVACGMAGLGLLGLISAPAWSHGAGIALIALAFGSAWIGSSVLHVNRSPWRKR